MMYIYKIKRYLVSYHDHKYIHKFFFLSLDKFYFLIVWNTVLEGLNLCTVNFYLIEKKNENFIKVLDLIIVCNVPYCFFTFIEAI